MTAAARLSDDPARPVLANMWLPIVLRGLVAVAFAIMAYNAKTEAVTKLAPLFAGYAVIDGILSIVGALRGGGLAARNWLALGGIVSIAAGAAAAFIPDITWPMLAMVIGAWSLARGLSEIMASLRLRKYMQRDWSLAWSGGWSIVLGVVVLLNTAMTSEMLVRLVSGFILVLGLMLVVLGVRFKRGFRD
jgi:uncharacterized membrane protein HdeD (DUF308 family)